MIRVQYNPFFSSVFSRLSVNVLKPYEDLIFKSAIFIRKTYIRTDK